MWYVLVLVMAVGVVKGEMLEISGVRVNLHPLQHMIRWMTNNRGELRVGRAIRDAIAGCAPGRLFLDVGANIGGYGMAAAVKGCDVVLFEPLPSCQMYVREAIAANRVPNARLVPHPVGDPTRTLGVSPSFECRGRFPNNVLKAGESVTALEGRKGLVQVPFVNLTSYVPRDVSITFLKIDVEGAELDVLQQAMPLFRDRRVRASTVEVAPMLWQYRPEGVDVLKHRVASTLRHICEMGYTTDVFGNREGGDMVDITCTQLYLHVTQHMDSRAQDVYFRLPTVL